jgi:hypothetical protein
LFFYKGKTKGTEHRRCQARRVLEEYIYDQLGESDKQVLAAYVPTEIKLKKGTLTPLSQALLAGESIPRRTGNIKKVCQVRKIFASGGQGGSF